MKTSSIGTAAPAFILTDQDGNAISLATYKGKKHVVLIFYPGDNTPGCTKQLCTVTNDAARYAEANIVVFGINQGNQASHAAFVAHRKLTMPLLIDENLAVAALYGAVLQIGPLKIIRRTVIGIDINGNILYYRRGMPATQEIISAIAGTSCRKCCKYARITRDTRTNNTSLHLEKST